MNSPVPPLTVPPPTEGYFPGAWIASPSLKITNGEHLQCWSSDRAIYHIALHLADSIPASERAHWLEIRRDLTGRAAREGRELTPDERSLLRAAYDERVEKYLAAGYGSCWLRRADVAQAVAEVFEGFNGKGYQLHCWCIMPNHLHLIVAFDSGDTFRRKLKVWKRISAHLVNRLVGQSDMVWTEDAYTRIIRTHEEYLRQVSYVWNNPESAGLTESFLRKRYV